MSATTRQKMPLRLQVAFLYVGSTLLALGGWLGLDIMRGSQPSVLAEPVPTVPQHRITSSIREAIHGQPVRLSVERLGVDLPIAPGVYDAQTGEWSLADSTAFFIPSTAEPNELTGNTYIYAHNNRSAFSPLSGLREGDALTIDTDNGYRFTYVYTSDKNVAPDETSVITAKSDKPQVTLQTCEGLFSQARRLMYFSYQDVGEI